LELYPTQNEEFKYGDKNGTWTINRRVPTVVMRLVTIHLASVTYDEEEIGS
jgi:hypothetical protein